MKSARHIAYYILYTCSKYILTHIILSTVELKMLCMQSDVSVLQKLERKTKRGRGRERKFLFRVSSGSNERPLNNESLIMSVLIIKRELSGTKQLKSHYQTSLQKEGRKDGREERRGDLLYIYMSHKHKYRSIFPLPLL